MTILSAAPTILGKTPIVLANHYAEEYLRHLSDLNVLPHLPTRASSEMDEIIRFIQNLGEAGYAYEIHGDVYFRVHQRRRLWQAQQAHPRRSLERHTHR